MEERNHHNDYLKRIMEWVVFANKEGFANDDEVDEVRSKIHDVDLVLENIGKRIN